MSAESKCLLDILIYIGADTKYAEYAQLQTYLEWYAKKKIDREIDKGRTSIPLPNGEVIK